MKNLAFLLLFGLLFSRCSHAPAVDVADIRFKDSIARADGNKLLGNIQFGIDQFEFYDQKDVFLHEQHDSIFGYYIHDVVPNFTREQKLYAATFVCSIYEDQKPEEWPFRDFCLKKFGKEVPHRINHWKVGNRSISVVREKRKRGLMYALRCTYQSMQLNSKMGKEGYSSEDPNEKFNFYCLRIENDSLRAEDLRQEQEYYDNCRREDEQRKKAAQNHTEQSKKEDLRNL